MTRIWIATVIAAGLTCGCTATSNEQRTDRPAEPKGATDWELLDIGSNVSMRGLSVASESVVWLSGREGRFFRTVDGGETWQRGQVPGMAEVDFRDVEGVDASTAYLLSAGGTARIYGTTAGGQHWVQQYANDGGLTWTPTETPPRGYRSCVTVVPGTDGPTLVAVGPTGTDFSIDGGRRWQPLSDEGFHSVAFAGPELGWAAGDDGRVGRLTGYAFQPSP